METVGHSVVVLLLAVSLAGADYAEYRAFVEEQAQNETFVRLFDDHLKLFQDKGQLKDAEPFPCKKMLMPAANATTSVHRLRPSDVKVIGAIGDSITAGTGITATTVLGLLRQDRGLSWSIGGDKTAAEAQTLANFLKVYDPNIQGFSVGSGSVDNKKVSRFNLAHPGDKSEDMLGQAQTLVERMKNDQTINFSDDWKVITVFVGGNDLCAYCEDTTKYNAEHYVENVRKALDYFHENVPRAFVNMVHVLDIAIVKKLNANFVCDTLHFFLCKCGAFPKDSEDEQKLQEETEKYRKLLSELVEKKVYDDKDDFTVVVQPFFSKTSPPTTESGEPDLSYFAPDCFHLSLKGHRAAADGLWNNMLDPVGKKATTWTPGEAVDCPTPTSPYFYTSKNSGNQLEDPQESYGDTPVDNFLEEDVNTPSDEEQETGNQTSNVMLVVAVSGTCTLFFIIGAVAIKKRFQKKQANKERLLQSSSIRYTEI